MHVPLLGSRRCGSRASRLRLAQQRAPVCKVLAPLLEREPCLDERGVRFAQPVLAALQGAAQVLGGVPSLELPPLAAERRVSR